MPDCLREISTMLTDVGMGIAALVWGGILHRGSTSLGSRAGLFWAAGFISIGLGALAGGIYHGFGLCMPGVATRALWYATLYGISFASYAILVGSVKAFVLPVRQGVAHFAAFLKFMVFLVWFMLESDFRLVIYDYGLSLACVAVLQWSAGKSEPPARWIFSGIGISVVAAGIQQGGVSLHEHFNHNDLYHVVQTGALYCLYRGARLLKDRR